MVYVQDDKNKSYGPIDTLNKIEGKIKRIILCDGHSISKVIEGYDYYCMETEAFFRKGVGEQSTGASVGVTRETIYAVRDIKKVQVKLLTAFNVKLKKLLDSNCKDKQDKLEGLRDRYEKIKKLLEGRSVDTYTIEIKQETGNYHPKDLKDGLGSSFGDKFINKL